MGLLERAWKTHKAQIQAQRKIKRSKYSALDPRGIVLVLTNKCNFSCKHCLRDSRNDKELNFGIVEKILKEAKYFNFRRVSLTGGEPLLYSKLPQLIELAVEGGYVFSIATNGWVFGEHLAVLTRHRSHVDKIIFSLEDTSPVGHDTIRRQGSFKNLMENFALCRKNNIPFVVLTVVSPRNHENLFNIALLAKREGARGIVFSTMMPCARTVENKLVLDKARRDELSDLLPVMSRDLKFPVITTAAIRTNGGFAMCRSLALDQLSVDIEGNLIQCCDLAGVDLPGDKSRICQVSVNDKSFEEALVAFSGQVNRFINERIVDYRACPDYHDVDFNSCFYCLKKLSR